MFLFATETSISKWIWEKIRTKWKIYIQQLLSAKNDTWILLISKQFTNIAFWNLIECRCIEFLELRFLFQSILSINELYSYESITMDNDSSHKEISAFRFHFGCYFCFILSAVIIFVNNTICWNGWHMHLLIKIRRFGSLWLPIVLMLKFLLSMDFNQDLIVYKYRTMRKEFFDFNNIHAKNKTHRKRSKQEKRNRNMIESIYRLLKMHFIVYYTVCIIHM